MVSLHELDSDLKYSVSSFENGIDLSLLTAGLVPPSKIVEKDEHWNFDDLLQSVTQEFHKDRENSQDLQSQDESQQSASSKQEAKAASGAPPAEGAGYEKDLNDEEARKMDAGLGTGGNKIRKEAAGGRRRRK